MRRIATIAAALSFGTVAALAQTSDTSQPPSQTEENGFLTGMIQDAISGPGREIAFFGVDGALSSRARIGKITLSDDKGPWLEIEDVELNWSRLQLLLGRFNVESLEIGRVAWLRKGEIPPAPPKLETESKPFALPELPVSIDFKSLRVGSIELDESVVGQDAELSVEGRFRLANGALDSELHVDRTDDPGGDLDLVAAFSNENREVVADLDLHAPSGGLLSTLLKIEGEPALDLTLDGGGPLDNADFALKLDADNEQLVQGQVALRGEEAGLGFDVDLDARLARLIPADFRDFFAGETRVDLSGTSKKGGGFLLDAFSLQGDLLNLAGSAETGADNFPVDLELSGSFGDAAGEATVLPVPGARTSLQSGRIHLNYGDASRWAGYLVLDRLRANELELEDVTLTLGGLARNLDDPASRDVTISVEGLATGVHSDNTEAEKALGNRIDLFVDAVLPQGAPIELRQFQIAGKNMSVFGSGEIDGTDYNGRLALRAPDLAVFSGLAGRPLAGSAQLHADANASPLTGAFRISIDGTTTDISAGIDAVDGLLVGKTILSGNVRRDGGGIHTDDLLIENPQLRITSDGTLSTKGSDIGFTADVADLAVTGPQNSGSLSLRGRATGNSVPIALEITAASPEARIMDHAFSGLEIVFDGQTDGTGISGDLAGTGQIDEMPLAIAGDIDVSAGEQSVQGLRLALGPTTLTGEVTRSGQAPIEGQLDLSSPDLKPVAALAMQDAAGAIDAQVTLSGEDKKQAVGARIDAEGIEFAGNRIETLTADVHVGDVLGHPLAEGTLTAAGLTAGGVEIASVDAKASHDGPETMRFAADTRLAIGTLADISGDFEWLADGFAATLDNLRIRQGEKSAQLNAPTTISLEGGNISVTPLSLDVGNGHLSAEGTVGETLDLNIGLEAIPLDIANAFLPDLGLAGHIEGTARIAGPRNGPDLTFDIAADGLAASATRDAGLPDVALKATGKTEGSLLDLDAELSSGDGLSLTAVGAVPLGKGEFDLAIDLAAFPLALVDAAAGNQGLSGTLTGTASVNGAMPAPEVNFDIDGERLSADLLADIDPFTLNLKGGFAQNTVTLEQARVSGAPGLDFTAAGTIPLSGPGLDIRADGAAPLELANPFLNARTAEASGDLVLKASATGSLSQPNLGGSARISNGAIFDPGTNLRLENIQADAALEGRNAVLRSLRADVTSGGTISAEGTVSTDPAAGFPADLRVGLDDVVYTDGTLIVARFDGDLALEGPLQGGGGVLSGRIDLKNTELTIPEGLGASGSALLNEVRHVRPRPRTVATLERAKVGEPEPPKPSGQSGIGLDLFIDSPRAIFIRGRGIDAELGGNLSLTGPASDLKPVGEFKIRRGRIEILTQRIDFTRGELSLDGNLDPRLDFLAETSSGDVTARVAVTGRTSDPEITFSSSPQLPEDEVLAHLLFNKSVSDLSTFQIAELAAAAAELAGSAATLGVLSGLRAATGLDDLEVVEQDSGATGVRAGKYIDDNIYLDVQTDSDGVSQIGAVLDFSEDFNVRGSVASDGNTLFGLFYEHDY